MYRHPPSLRKNRERRSLLPIFPEGEGTSVHRLLYCSTQNLKSPLQPAVSLVLSGIIVLPKLLLSVEQKEWVGVFPCISCNVMYTERYSF